jgi:hypothetical protein
MKIERECVKLALIERFYELCFLTRPRGLRARLGPC